ncbi:hypothetical protein LSH36_59g01041 [Paralvinella palmiformis]|uniref:Methyltransferase-like protein 22 n=1 Tax=Paralvinella palmiformis TaxID=53620 RepID=A0AAD9NDY7_9ANNE|nr:hypothetical protein LSH36_59g01041 [Paralvinella palmiformis]
MEPHEVALSDVHVYGPSLTNTDTSHKDYQVVRTRFLYTLECGQGSQWCPDPDPSYSGNLEPDTDSENEIELDEDGDLKVWRGCLLLCDFILDRLAMFEDATVIELGGGTGLASIVVATVARAVISTDVGQDVLTLCQKNVETHKHLYVDKTVIVRELDWSKEELNTMIYDDNLTDSFFNTINKLMCQKPGRKTILALEKRLNFTLSNLDVGCPAYDHFKNSLDQLHSYSNRNGVHFTVSQVTSIQQFFYYDRNKYLVILCTRR